jgi:hypothetical protein
MRCGVLFIKRECLVHSVPRARHRFCRLSIGVRHGEDVRVG